MTYWIWIGADNVHMAKALLQRKGVDVGPFNEEWRQFENCTITPEVLKEIKNYWGVYRWGLEVTDEIQ